MKKYFLLSFAIVLLTSCGSTLRESWNHFPKEIDLEKYQHLDFVKVHKGSKVMVTVDENESTGYHWRSQSQENCSATVNDNGYIQGDVAEGMVGVPGTRTFEITGKEIGSCLVEFQNYAPGNQETPEERKGIYFIVE